MLSVHLLPTLLDEGLNPCPPDGAGCRQIGSVLAVPIASEFKISVSPLVVGVGEKLTVRLSSSLPRCTIGIAMNGVNGVAGDAVETAVGLSTERVTAVEIRSPI